MYDPNNPRPEDSGLPQVNAQTFKFERVAEVSIGRAMKAVDSLDSTSAYITRVYCLGLGIFSTRALFAAKAVNIVLGTLGSYSPREKKVLTSLLHRKLKSVT